MIFFSDFEKAFDSIDHDYLIKCLRHFNFGDSFVNWIKLFYANAKSCVSNNGHLSDFFPIQRGVRQGCPLSPYLFIIGIELLTNQIRTNKNIKGITLAGSELKNTCYADDASFILDGSQKSFETLIDVLENFNFISGLKLNSKKCQVLRIGPLKNTNIIFLRKKKFVWSSIEARALGMTFCTNTEDVFKLNLEPKLNQFEVVLKQWQHRKLTLLGKITVIKTFAIPKLIYALSCLPNPQPSVIKHLETLMYSFLWNGKPEKVKRKILIQNYDKGGLKMIDIDKFIQAQKISWIKQIFDPNNKTALNEIYHQRLSQFGGALLFECNFSKNDILKHFNKNTFLTNILIAWNKISKRDTILDYSNEIVWNNSNIYVGNNTVFYKTWLGLGIKYIKDIYDYSSKQFYSFEKIKEIYNVPNEDFLKYFSLVQSISNYWKSQLKHENGLIPIESKIINQIFEVKQTNKFAYKLLLQSDKNEEDKSEQKWNSTFTNEGLNWKKNYTTPILATGDIKIREFQYKCLKRIIPSNVFLHKCKLVDSSLCDFCHMEIETVNHMFWECMYVQTFWMQLKNYLNENGFEIDITLKTSTFGIQDQQTNENKLKNVMILLAKYFIFKNKCKKTIPNLEAFKFYIKNRLTVEKEISLLKDKLREFQLNWEIVLRIFE